MPFLKFLRRMCIGSTGVIGAIYLNKKNNEYEKVEEFLLSENEYQLNSVPESLKNLLDEIKASIKFDSVKQTKHKIYLSKGVDLSHYGALWFSNATYIAVPNYFLFDKDSDVDLNAVMDEGNSLTDPTDVNTLKQSLCLSKEAKKFALACELFKSHHTPITPCLVLPFGITLNLCFLSYIIEKNAIRQRKQVRLHTHCFLILLGLSFFVSLYDALSVYKEVDSDFLACQLGSSYIKGGIEYYEKLMARNKIIRKVQKNAPYAEDGDLIKSFFRKNHIPINERLIYLKEIQNGIPVKSIWSYAFLP